METITQSVVVAPMAAQSLGDSLSKLVGARREFIKSIKTGDKSLGAYAAWVCSTFNVTDETGAVIKPWYSLGGKAAAGVRAEFASFKADLMAEGYAEAWNTPTGHG